jgi:hypothetical protein
VPAIHPPRRLTRAGSMMPPEEPPPTVAPPSAIAASASRPPRPAEADLRDDPPPSTMRLRVTAAAASADPIPPARSEQPPEDVASDAPQVRAVRSERPRADFVFDAPRFASSHAKVRNRIPFETRPPVEPAGATAPLNGESAAHPARAMRTRHKQDAVPSQDPVAVGLAAAGRWVASDAAPATVNRSAHRTDAAATATDRPIARSTPNPAEPVTHPSALAAAAPPLSPARPLPSAGHAHAAEARMDGTQRDAAPDRFTGIHIGSVAVEILPPPEPAKPAVAPPARPRAGGLTGLARGLTSSIGLRQS